MSFKESDFFAGPASDPKGQLVRDNVLVIEAKTKDFRPCVLIEFRGSPATIHDHKIPGVDIEPPVIERKDPYGHPVFASAKEIWRSVPEKIVIKEGDWFRVGNFMLLHKHNGRFRGELGWGGLEYDEIQPIPKGVKVKFPRQKRIK